MKEFSGSPGFPCYSGAAKKVFSDNYVTKNVFQVEKKIKKNKLRAIIRKWKTYKTTDNLPRSGAPLKVLSHGVKMIMRMVRKNHRTTRRDLMTKVSKATISNTLHREGLKYCSARRVPLLKPVHVQAHLKFAREHMNDPEEDCNNQNY